MTGRIGYDPRRMAQFLLISTLFTIAGLIATMVLGFTASPGHHANHIMLALGTVVIGLFSQSMTMFFFIGTGKEIKDKVKGAAEESDIVQMALFVVVGLVTAKLRRDAERLHALAMTDDLTGLQNSRSFHDATTSELRGLSRTGWPLTLACIDIDGFKMVNDRLGHAAGDEVLVGTARTLAAAMREVDTVARIGGEFRPDDGRCGSRTAPYRGVEYSRPQDLPHSVGTRDRHVGNGLSNNALQLTKPAQTMELRS